MLEKIIEFWKDKAQGFIIFWTDKTKKGHSKQLFFISIFSLILAICYSICPEVLLFGFKNADKDSLARFGSASSSIYYSFFGGTIAIWFMRKYSPLIEKHMTLLKNIFLGLFIGLAPIMGGAAALFDGDKWIQCSILISAGFSAIISIYLAFVDKLLTVEEKNYKKEQKKLQKKTGKKSNT